MIELRNGFKANRQVESKQRGHDKNLRSQREEKSAAMYQKEIFARQEFTRGVESIDIKTS